MNMPLFVKASTLRQTFIVKLVALAVAANGVFIIYNSLIVNVIDRDDMHFTRTTLDVRIIAALGLLYLSQLLARQKRAAWAIAIALYAYILGVASTQIFTSIDRGHYHLIPLIQDIIVPLLILACLLVYRAHYTVKSDVRNFALSLRFVLAALLIAFLYGVVGFMLLDNRDFRQHLSFWEAVHRTVDQFNFTTNHSLTAHTYRARAFIDSLSTISIGALFYSAIALFQPIKARYAGQTHSREVMQQILLNTSMDSEDYFKLWPHDKNYLFSRKGERLAGIAYHVSRGIALSAGGPAGDSKLMSQVVRDYEELCKINDWQPAFIHSLGSINSTYKKHGYSLQKLGEEAVVDLRQFNDHVRNNKYFRQINNRFEKQNYSFEVLQPSHSKALIQRLRDISNEWLKQPGRAERAFMMSYFSEAYVQQCAIGVARDEAGTIQAFINLVPTYNGTEANYDMLRHSSNAIGNVNDYLLLSLLAYLPSTGATHFNLGLCPLTGLDADDANNSIIDNALRFVYANGDRFYSFSGLHRFKAKYEPSWRNRYVAYKGGVRGFARTMSGLTQALRVPRHLRD